MKLRSTSVALPSSLGRKSAEDSCGTMMIATTPPRNISTPARMKPGNGLRIKAEPIRVPIGEPQVWPAPKNADMVPRTFIGIRSEIMATSGAIMAFRPNMHRQYTMVMSTGLLIMPVRNRVTPPSTAPSRMNGVRRPHLERERSDSVPNSRLETSEAMAVQALMVPTKPSTLSPAIPCRCLVSNTEETIPRPLIHSRPNTRKPAPKRNSVTLSIVLPVSGDSAGFFSAAAIFALYAAKRSSAVAVIASLIVELLSQYRP